MNDTKQPSGKADDEIDLRYFFAKIESFFLAIFRGVKRAFFSSLRNWVLVAGIAFFGACAAYAIFKLQRPTYTSSMTVVLSELRNDFVEGLIKNLEVMVKEGNTLALSKTLKISEASAEQIESIKFFNIDAHRVPEDSVLLGGPFGVQVTSYQNNLFDSLEVGIVNYVETNPYFNRMKTIKRDYLQTFIDKLTLDLRSIDSLRTTVANPKASGSGFVYGSAVDPTNLYRQSVEILEKRTNFEGQLKRVDNLQVVNSFVPHKWPTGPNRNLHLLLGALIGGLLGLTMALIKDSRKGIL
ncbi:chain length determinant protein [Rufibacter sp. LB8]|uniref:chain length determinant protein n=1 Tax=Rufibacter sp. LB8 TaxID=2777781 RepID=UPI00178C6910|nr:chain length determinant protein [Rufibacter sp. LB8]